MNAAVHKIDGVYKVVCPLCFEKREVSYQSKSAVVNKRAKGYCKTCSRLKMSLAKFKLYASNETTMNCQSCNCDIPVTKSYKSYYEKHNDSSYTCFSCLLNERIFLREENIKKEIKKYEGNQFKKSKSPETIKMFGCVLTEQQHKQNGHFFDSKRCDLADHCVHFYSCLDKISHLGWKGFTSSGEGSPIEFLDS